VERNTEQLAWAVLVGAFGVFCLLLLAIPNGVNLYLAKAMSDRPVRLDVIKGTTLLLPAGGRQEVNAPSRSTLVGGEQIRTASDSEALLSFFDGSNVHLWPNTTVRILTSKSSTFRQTNTSFVVAQDAGHARYEVAIPSTSARNFEIQTPQSHALLREGSYRLEASPTESVLAVSAGSATVSGQEGAVEVLHGESTTVTDLARPTPPQPSRSNVLTNGDFAQKLSGWQPGQRDVADGLPGSIATREEDNRTFVEFARDLAPRHAETFLHRSVNQDVSDADSLRFALQVRILRQDLSTDGPIGFEAPILVRIHYRDSSGSETTWSREFFLRDEQTPIVRDSRTVAAGLWTDESFDLFDPNVISPRPSEILWIEIAASGRGYLSDAGNVQLLAE
jgi:hypothetical protein